MAFTLKIVVPEKVVLEEKVTSVILPTSLGEIEILEGHLPIMGLLEAGTVFYKNNGAVTPIAIDAGFYKLHGTELVLLVEAAIDVQVLDESSIDAAVRRAQEALEKAKQNKTVDEDELERLDKMLRFQIAQKLTKQAKR